MSQALGTFEHNWTLTCVCVECNQYFGDTFEIVLGRDSLEGFIRAEVGVKPLETVNAFLNRRALFTLQNPGNLGGARIVMKAIDGELWPEAPAQVAFRSEGSDWHYLLERDLTREALEQLRGPHVEIKVLGRHCSEDIARLLRRLADLGLHFTETQCALDQPLSSGSIVTVIHEITVDTALRRAAAKIGFNYLARVLGGDRVRQAPFDTIRRFVRHGEEPEPLVSAQEGSILIGPDAVGSLAHVCAFGWEPARGELIGIVSLFNRVTYGLRLCRGDSPEWQDVWARHVFDPISRRISPLAVAD